MEGQTDPRKEGQTDRPSYIETRPDTRHKMRLVCVVFTFENNTGHTDGRTDGRTDTTSYRDATAHLKIGFNLGLSFRIGSFVARRMTLGGTVQFSTHAMHGSANLWAKTVSFIQLVIL